MSNQIGTVFRLTTFGESHGAGIGAVLDGCPAAMALSEQDIQGQLDRRRPGQSDLVTPRDESDRIQILSGVEAGVTLGTPIALFIENRNRRPGDYCETADTPRPSHADYTWKMKYGVAAASGGGRASARETAARVAGGAIAEKLLAERHGVEIVAWVSAVSGIEAKDLDVSSVTREDVDATPVRCPDSSTAGEMKDLIESVRTDGDSVGGVITCVCRNVPVGWGEPVFGKINAMLAGAVMSIPAVRGFEVGMGFAASCMRGSEHNDMFVPCEPGSESGGSGRLRTATNRSGGIQGGISNGETIVFRAAFKPVSTISKAQETVGYDGKPVTLEMGGRHDPCVLPRAVPIVESMAALVLADMSLLAAI